MLFIAQYAFIDTEVLYLPRVQSYLTLIDEYTLLKDVLFRRKKVKKRDMILTPIHGTYSVTEFTQSMNSSDYRKSRQAMDFVRSMDSYSNKP